MNITKLSSPNFDTRKLPIQFIILHYTDMPSARDALDRLCDPSAKVSAHYVVGEKGEIWNLVAEDNRAWHAGQSFWHGITDINSASIGIELANKGHSHDYPPFPAAQIETLQTLLKDIMTRHKILPHNILGHSDIAPSRKIDPGEKFPWKKLAQNGFGIWPETKPEDYLGFKEIMDEEVQNLLIQIGYDCGGDAGYNKKTRDVLLAFQRHFHPENLTGTPEKETIARLRALIRHPLS